MRKKFVSTGSRFGDVLLVGVFAMAAAVGILTTTLLLSFDAGSASLGDAKVEDQLLGKSQVVLGDSLAQGVGASSAKKTLSYLLYEQAQKNDSGLKLWNFGTAGAVASQVVSEQLPRLAAVQVGTVYLIIGANDVTRQTQPATFRQQFQEIMTAVAASGGKVTVFNIAKLSATPAVPEQNKAAADARTKELNAIIAQEVAKYGGVTLFDFYAFTEANLTQDSGLLAEDKFHPNDAGYQKIADKLVE